MLTSLAVVSFFFIFAGLQQAFLNRLIKADLEELQRSRLHFHANSAPPSLSSSDSHAS